MCRAHVLPTISHVSHRPLHPQRLGGLRGAELPRMARSRCERRDGRRRAAHWDCAKSSSPFFLSSSAWALKALASSESMTLLLAALDFFPMTVLLRFQRNESLEDAEGALDQKAMKKGLGTLRRAAIPARHRHRSGRNVLGQPSSTREVAPRSWPDPRASLAGFVRGARLVGFLERRYEFVELLSCQLNRHLANALGRFRRPLGVCVQRGGSLPQTTDGKRRRPGGDGGRTGKEKLQADERLLQVCDGVRADAG